MKTLKKRVDAANTLSEYERQLKRNKSQLTAIKTGIENLKIVIDADADFPQSDKDFMQSAFNLVNHASYTGFIDLIQNQLGD